MCADSMTRAYSNGVEYHLGTKPKRRGPPGGARLHTIGPWWQETARQLATLNVEDLVRAATGHGREQNSESFASQRRSATECQNLGVCARCGAKKYRITPASDYNILLIKIFFCGQILCSVEKSIVNKLCEASLIKIFIFVMLLYHGEPI